MLKSKVCCTCKTEKDSTEFGARTDKRHLLRSECRLCSRQRKRMFNHAACAESLLRHRYGISLADKATMFKNQKGLCAICRKPSQKSLHVDHDHQTGKIRGLLCHNCNRGIGYLHDSIEVLQEAMIYLQRRKL